MATDPNQETSSEEGERRNRERREADAAAKATEEMRKRQEQERLQNTAPAAERAKNPVAPTKLDDGDVTEDEYRTLSPLRKAQVDKIRRDNAAKNKAAAEKAEAPAPAATPKPKPQVTRRPMPDRKDYLSPRDYNADLEKWKAEQEADPDKIAQNRVLRKMQAERG